VLKKHAAKRYMEVPPNCLIKKSAQFERVALASFVQTVIEKSQEGFFNSLSSVGEPILGESYKKP